MQVMGVVGSFLTTTVVAAGVFVLAVVAVGSTALIGGSDGVDHRCDGRVVSLDAGAAATFAQKWSTLDRRRQPGTSATMTETELSSRADAYLRDRDLQHTDLAICLRPGEGEARVAVDVPGVSSVVGDLTLTVRGTVDLSGRQTEATVRSLSVGRLPGAIATRLVGSTVERVVREDIDGIRFNHRYDVGLGAGSVTLTRIVEDAP